LREACHEDANGDLLGYGPTDMHEIGDQGEPQGRMKVRVSVDFVMRSHTLSPHNELLFFVPLATLQFLFSEFFLNELYSFRLGLLTLESRYRFRVSFLRSGR